MVVVEYKRITKRTNYDRGRSFEYRVKGYLKDKGYWVIRAAGSKGCADLVALAPADFPHRILMISCKANGKIPLEEKQTLYKEANRVDALPLLAEPAIGKGSKLKFSRIREHKVLKAGPTELLASPIDI